MKLKSYLYGFTALIAFVNLSYGAESILQGNAELKQEYKLELNHRYHSAIQYYNDTIIHMVEKAEEKGKTEGIEIGKAEGIEIGKAEGEKMAKLEMARKMLKRDRPIDEIIEDTGLTEADIETLTK